MLHYIIFKKNLETSFIFFLLQYLSVTIAIFKIFQVIKFLPLAITQEKIFVQFLFFVNLV